MKKLFYIHFKNALSTYLNDASETEEQHISDNRAESLPVEHPPAEKVNHHEVHHK
jgi:hypothetical protein